MAVETDLQGPRNWMSRLFLSGLLVLASLSLGMQLPVSEGSGYRQNHGPLVLATTTGSGSYILAKSSRAIQLVRKQDAKDSGPDKAPRISVFGRFPVAGEGARLFSSTPVSDYSADNILFRSGSRAISPRAPPVHFSG